MKKIRFSLFAFILLAALLLPAFSVYADDASVAGEETVGGITDEIVSKFAGSSIGALTGSSYDDYLREQLPESNIEYFNSISDLAIALNMGKIEGYIIDEPSALPLLEEYTDQYVLAEFVKCSYAYLYPKDSDFSDTLCEQMNEYLAKIKQDGTYDEILNIWMGEDESKKVVEYDDLTGENGEVVFATCTTIGIPFTYIKDNKYVGFDVDMAVRFCREYGYSIEIMDSTPAGMLALVASGKCDFAGAAVAVTDERREAMNFSDYNYESSIVLIAREQQEEETTETLEDLCEQLRGSRIAVLSGSISDQIAEATIPECIIDVYNSCADVALALDSDKCDAYVIDEPVALIGINQYPNQYIYAYIRDDVYGFIFQKDNERSDLLRAQLNAFLQELSIDGTLDSIKALWTGTDEDKKVVDMRGLIDINGTVNFADSSSVGMPFFYKKDDQYVGYELDIMVRFCREYGYALNITDSDFSGMLASVTTGKSDIGGGCITITEERKEIMNFSDPFYTGGIVIVKKDTSGGSGTGESKTSFFDTIAESFSKTFIRESRWKMFVSGILTTLMITVISAICGTILAFLIFLLYRKKIKVVKIIVDVLSDILQKTPIVVILMILYYIIFGRSSLEGQWVSCIGFSFIFACAVIGQLKVSVSAVDNGQMEAAMALGYTDTKAFLKIILPQALEFFLPGYKSELVALIKGTAIVGYIAVQDLTKISDIVRSRTYEPFFPLIATAIIYFGLAWLLTFIVGRIQVKTNPKHRSSKAILKGADEE